jgi:hypothetical protein
MARAAISAPSPSPRTAKSRMFCTALESLF